MSGSTEQPTPAPPVEHIVCTPGTCGGRPRVAGTRIRVQDIALWHEADGLAPEEILLHYQGITLSDVYAALAYYHDHRDEIRDRMKKDEEFVESFKKEHPSRLAEILKARHAGDDSVSS